MGFWNVLFGGKQLSPEEEKQEQEAKNFDLLKYDGVKAMKIGQTEYAVRCFQEALKVQEDLEIHDYLSQALLRLGELEGTLGELKLLAEAEPENKEIQKRIAQVAYMQEDYATMSLACERAMQLDAADAQVFFLNAQAQQGQQNPVAAIAMLTKAIALEPNYADAYLMRGRMLLAMGDKEGAEQDVAWLMEHVNDHEDILLLKARTEAALGRKDDAIATYTQVTEVNPFCIDAFRERGQLRFDAGDKEGAEADMQKVLELDPNQLADVNGEYSAEGIEQRVRQAYSAINPLGL
jgi:tetratricopeptide (TPR) repeat protein